MYHSSGRYKIKTFTMIDSGATSPDSTCFIDSTFCKKYKLLSTPLLKPKTLELVDGNISSGSSVTDSISVTLCIGQHIEEILCYVTSIAKFDLILGKAWLHKHHPLINWKEDYITFKSSCCHDICLQQGCYQDVAYGVTRTDPCHV